MRALRLALLLTLTLPLLAADQKMPAERPCSLGYYRAFDFWVGDWDLSWPGSDAMPAGSATNKITRELDNCVIKENFEGEKPSTLHGMSVSTYDKNMKKWKQTWVDNEGSYLDFTGTFSDNGAIFERDASDKDGKPIKQRMVWKVIDKDNLDWSWERSDNGGQDWKVLWPIHYTRMGKVKVQEKQQKTKPWYKQW